MTQADVFEFIKSFSGSANILTIPRVFIDFCDGDIESALMLSQLIYWTGRGSIDDGWIFKSHLDWEAEIGLSRYKSTKAKNLLEKKGVIETSLRKYSGAPTLHYRIKQEAFLQSIAKFLNNRLSKNYTMDCSKSEQSSYTEITDIDYGKDYRGNGLLFGNQDSSKSSDTELFNQTLKSFLWGYERLTGKNKFSNHAKEGRNIQRLIKTASAMNPESPAELMKVLIKTFWSLANSGSKFWKEKAFTPSEMLASYDAILRQAMEKEFMDSKTRDAIQSVAGMKWR